MTVLRRPSRRSTLAHANRDVPIGLCDENPGHASNFIDYHTRTFLDEADRGVLAVGHEIGHIDQVLHGVAREQRDDEDRRCERHAQHREARADRMGAILRSIITSAARAACR